MLNILILPTFSSLNTALIHTLLPPPKIPRRAKKPLISSRGFEKYAHLKKNPPPIGIFL